MKIGSNSHQTQQTRSKMPDNYGNEGPDGPNREVSADGIWNFGNRDSVDICGGGGRESSSYDGCGDSGGDSGGGAFLG
jgi:hypothetical protein